MKQIQIFSATYGKVVAAAPTHNGRTIIRVKSVRYGNLYYFVDICFVEKGEDVSPRTELGRLYVKED